MFKPDTTQLAIVNLFFFFFSFFLPHNSSVEIWHLRGFSNKTHRCSVVSFLLGSYQLNKFSFLIFKVSISIQLPIHHFLS